jgi:heat-inducible transcriptional repressor
MLTDRRSTLLNLIVEEYVDTALPVGSKYIVAKHDMPVSSATVRLEMARLEDEGYISQPHTSAGRVPSDKGYRYYVESLMAEEARPCWRTRSATSPSSRRPTARRRVCGTSSWCRCTS